MKIVIVDDDKSIRIALRVICESGRRDEVVAEFDSGVGLLDYLASHPVDVVCLDYHLPGQNGLDLLRQIDVRANPVSVILITGSTDPDLRGQAADAGATGFILKPFSNDQVIEELNAIEQTRRIAARASVAPPPPVSSIHYPSASGGIVPKSAVLIDDSSAVRLLVKGILDGMGIKVVGMAGNGASGVEVVRKTRPALVCLDVDMPNMTGLEALPLIREASPQTKVVMVTGNAGRQVVESAIAGGASGYFLKPIRPARVEEFMRKLLRLPLR